MSHSQTPLGGWLVRNRVWALLLLAALWPLADMVLPERLHVLEPMRTVFTFAILALGLNVVTGFTGLLNLGVAAFMAIGAYTFGIATCEIYPFQVGFWGGLLLTLPIGAAVGMILGAPLLRLRGDYLAIVTLGFGEIVQDVLKNLDVISKGTQGINPLPAPSFLGAQGSWRWGALEATDELGWYYLLLGLLTLAVWACRNLERSRIGRAWVSLREDELAARSMGIRVERAKLVAFAVGAALAAASGGLFAAAISSTGEPSNYDFQVSILALCIVIVGGTGSVAGVLLGSLVMVGANSIVLTKFSEWITESGWGASGGVLTSPNNWKFLIFGLVLVLMVRFRPQGIMPPVLEGHPSSPPEAGRKP